MYANVILYSSLFNPIIRNNLIKSDIVYVYMM
jgi:hypothetical protein